ncbi:hypothetical protein SD77_4418 [Bacillus badius]|uniref:Ribose 5-phosphate isomerase B n=1 Tax=Bacillus badius TaxID=1455 RepID=A0ABR5AWZ0_BACBA|nr:hypothetical protein SD78_0721 [Bacillus badius]KIL78738.1 hypothetical protein SD77_4418 [Bacillus badius]
MRLLRSGKSTGAEVGEGPREEGHLSANNLAGRCPCLFRMESDAVSPLL